MRRKVYEQVSKERYDILVSRYAEFLKVVTDDKSEVVTVFDPLTQKQLGELELIREISQELQNKKDEDIRKAAEAAAAQEEEKEEKEENAEEENVEDEEQNEIAEPEEQSEEEKKSE